MVNRFVARRLADFRACLLISLSGFAGALLMSGCGGGTPEQPTGQVNYALGPVDGGTCGIFDAATGKKLLAGPRPVQHGVAKFYETTALGFVLLQCSDGTYQDEATGKRMVSPTLRSYMTIGKDEFTGTVSPLTELAIRINETGGFVKTDFALVLANVASSFGLAGVDVATVTPYDLNAQVADSSDGGRYGVVLAGLSQVQLDSGLADANAAIALLLAGFEENGYFKDTDAQDLYYGALDDLTQNPIIQTKLGDGSVVESLFTATTQSSLAATVTEVYAAFTDDMTEGTDAGIEADVPTTFGLIGENLYLGIVAKLGDQTCRVRDLGPADFAEGDYVPQILYADCPAVPAGTYKLDFFDGDREISFLNVSAANHVMALQAKAARLTAKSAENPKAASASAGSGPVTISGTVVAEQPTITPPSASHDYSRVTTFNVAGVAVNLINSSSAVLASTTTDANGNYTFTGVADGINVQVVVRAEIAMSRSGAATGPQYDFTVRDNTSTTNPKSAYQLTSPALLTSAKTSPQTVNFTATVGFDSNGKELSSAARQSGPFAIMRIAKSAVDKLVMVDPNLSLINLDFFWSTKNIGVSGDRDIGEIGTSFYSASGTQPGVYILGKADADTDEFDQGVIGHELGHYLQKQLASSDSPGGSHTYSDFKDASLAYSEGYGTAVGGLLATGQYSNFYCDTSGIAESEGNCIDLTQDYGSGARGFYSENTILRLLYAIGSIQNKGFVPFFNAVTANKTQVYSQTIFAFLNNYRTANPNVDSQVLALMAKYNIKSSNPLGMLSAGSAADPAINAAATKGKAPTGANDLETVYITLPLKAPVAAPPSDDKAIQITQNESTFCFNGNLPGADSQNGLGSSKRFFVTANYDGFIGVKVVDSKGAKLSAQSTNFNIRDDSGMTPSAYGFVLGATEFQVKNGRSYSILVHTYDQVYQGSKCGFKVSLFHTAD